MNRSNFYENQAFDFFSRKSDTGELTKYKTKMFAYININTTIKNINIMSNSISDVNVNLINIVYIN